MLLLPLRAFPVMHHGFSLPTQNQPRMEAVRESHRFNRFMDFIARDAARRILSDGTPDSLVAGISIGRFGYYSRLPIVDMVGIVDPVVARSEMKVNHPFVARVPGHQRTNADYILRRRPDYILGGIENIRAFPACMELINHPEFKKRYRYLERLRAYKRRRSR
jgi:hypothetical protein